jgi:dephospho-CoA kinase
MIVGLTGGMACGKSTVAEIFRGRGFLSVDCDELVREKLARDREVIAAVGEQFGDAVIASDGTVDRAALAEVVFDSPAALEWLEALLHPRVNREWRHRTERHPSANWVVQIPLLFEKRLEKQVDLTVCVASNPRVQQERLRRRGVGERQARARISRQWPLEAKMEFSDYVILNDGSVGFLREQVMGVIRCLGVD